MNNFLKDSIAIILHLLAIGFMYVWAISSIHFTFGVGGLITWMVVGALLCSGLLWVIRNPILDRIYKL
jgi:hypothetical protein